MNQTPSHGSAIGTINAGNHLDEDMAKLFWNKETSKENLIFSRFRKIPMQPNNTGNSAVLSEFVQNVSCMCIN